MRYFLSFAYMGTAYHGWQLQPNGLTVQQVMEDAFQTVLRQRVELTAAGRTDTGVHARLMVAHFDINEPIADEARWLNRLNSLLPKDIALLSLKHVRDDAHARFDAISRTYEYYVTTRKDPFLEQKAVRVPKEIDFEAMNEAARYLLSVSDFGSFCKLHTDVKTTICHLTEAHWLPSDNHVHVFRITANRFLRNMVRAIVGTLFDVGMHKLKAEDMPLILEKKHRTAAGQSAPAHGLYLTDIVYPEDLYKIV